MDEAKDIKVSLDGRSWFGVDLKSLEISLETVNDKVVGKMVKCGQGCPLRSNLGKKVEDCLIGEAEEPFKRVCGIRRKGL